LAIVASYLICYFFDNFLFWFDSERYPLILQDVQDNRVPEYGTGFSSSSWKVRRIEPAFSFFFFSFSFFFLLLSFFFFFSFSFILLQTTCT